MNIITKCGICQRNERHSLVLSTEELQLLWTLANTYHRRIIATGAPDEISFAISLELAVENTLNPLVGEL